MHSIFDKTKILHVQADGTNYAVSAGTTDVTSDAVDCLGFGSVDFIVTMGDNADTGTFQFYLEGSNDNSTWTAISGASVSITAGASDTDNEMLGVGVRDLTYRYVRSVCNRGTANTVVAALHAILSNPRDYPTTQSTSAGDFAAAPVVV